eukprot:c42670_g1_i1 orf=200-403(+)
MKYVRMLYLLLNEFMQNLQKNHTLQLPSCLDRHNITLSHVVSSSPTSYVQACIYDMPDAVDSKRFMA